MFKLTTLNTDAPLPTNEDGTTDYSEDLFGKKAFITGTGQLHGETFAQAFGKIYTFKKTYDKILNSLSLRVDRPRAGFGLDEEDEEFPLCS